MSRLDRIRLLTYPILLVLLLAAWATWMTVSGSWPLFREWWPVSVTMAFGSFVAGSTAAGGGAVAYPVFTKILHIPSVEARTFGLMIQSVGMTMASVVILTRRIPVIPSVIVWASVGGVLGQILGIFWVQLPGSYPRVLFTAVTATFGVALVISRWVLRANPRETVDLTTPMRRFRFVAVGVVGGVVAANVGSGIDLLTFMVLTLEFGVCERISTPTTVVIMAINSLAGFAALGTTGRVGIVWSYWLCAVPIVAVGAPLGAWFASRVHRDVIIRFLLVLIFAELVTTLALVRIEGRTWTLVAIGVVLSSIWFGAMLRYRQREHVAD
jgi:uncharacterized membrane protein YfcA